MAYTNVTNYKTPWTMWGGSVKKHQEQIGNVKLGPTGIKCPEDHTVRKPAKNVLVLLKGFSSKKNSLQQK